MAANPSSDDLLGDHTPSELMENMMFLARELQLIGPEPLPAVNEAQLRRLEQLDSSCPICLIPFSAVIAEEETASAMESPAYADQDMGVTRLKNVVEGEAGHLEVDCDWTYVLSYLSHPVPQACGTAAEEFIEGNGTETECRHKQCPS
ncbi:hypothetical protein PUNSTDRAFT_43667 [Punctularia strigosozonata HHB-11173 SS5]|uniref:uncharacterized protein n=1 Tax=Punctularia strigosozonata (strain HHB-11173) TaxID=741275 RepID=UPI000441731C|nr:uncharacterized protein PUNSTDRAFT_43667 [Punctularia strigosozonata HHB-11173 SS5]EIN10924.1 hypothetical protein PUNSTDRAFT_43667 [Punctularia strigosozonata HHB-11173 SS5]